MHNIYKSAIVFHPESQQELELILQKDSEALIVAGCTHLMRYASGKYPNKLNNTLIALDKYERLNTFKKTSGFVEIGSAVTLVKLGDIISSYLSPVLLDAINKTFSPSLQNRISIGGTIVPSSVIYDIAAPLMISGCILDVVKQTPDEFIEMKLPIDEYYSMSRDSVKKIFIKNILLPVTDRFQNYDGRGDAKYLDFYKTYSSSYYSPGSSIVLCASLTCRNDAIEEANLAVCYADSGVHIMQQTNSVLSDNVVVYLNHSTVNNMRNTFSDELEKFFSGNKRNSITCALFDKMIEEIQVDVL